MPALPTELVDYILHFAAASHSDTRAALRYVSKSVRVLTWRIHPIHVVINSPQRAAALEELLKTPFHKPFRIGSLWVDVKVAEDHVSAAAIIPSIFERCPYATKLYLSEAAFVAIAEAGFEPDVNGAG